MIYLSCQDCFESCFVKRKKENTSDDELLGETYSSSLFSCKSFSARIFFPRISLGYMTTRLNLTLFGAVNTKSSFDVKIFPVRFVMHEKMLPCLKIWKKVCIVWNFMRWNSNNYTSIIRRRFRAREKPSIFSKSKISNLLERQRHWWGKLPIIYIVIYWYTAMS